MCYNPKPLPFAFPEGHLHGVHQGHKQPRFCSASILQPNELKMVFSGCSKYFWVSELQMKDSGPVWLLTFDKKRQRRPREAE